MDLAVSLLISAVLATAEICATPFEGGADALQFCRLAATQKIETPYFSV